MFKRKSIPDVYQILQEFHGPSLETVLLHSDLCITIKEGSTILFEYILSNGGDWLKKIIDYALFDLSAPSDMTHLNRLHQINHNASNFLADSTSSFLDLLKKNEEFDGVELYRQSIKKFISPTNKTNMDPMYAGHFARFFTNILKYNFFDNYQNEIIENIIPFLTINSRILAYQNLLADMIDIFCKDDDQLIIYLIIQNILQVSYRSVKYIRRSYKEKENDFFINNADNQENNQPLNIKENSIPIWPLTLNKIENSLLTKDDDKHIKWKYDTLNFFSTSKKNQISKC